MMVSRRHIRSACDQNLDCFYHLTTRSIVKWRKQRKVGLERVVSGMLYSREHNRLPVPASGLVLSHGSPDRDPSTPVLVHHRGHRVIYPMRCIEKLQAGSLTCTPR
jgi:hypothetical protein